VVLRESNTSRWIDGDILFIPILDSLNRLRSRREVALLPESTPVDVRTRAVRRILAGVILLEALLCVGSGVFLVVRTAGGGAADGMASWVMAASAIVLGGVLFLAVRAARLGRKAVRSPLVVWQLMQLGVAQLTWNTAWVPLGVALAVLTVAGFVACFWPGVLEEE
jgi:hypothetical protein